MKKLTALILAVMTALAALVIPTSVSASGAAYGYLPGDANDDSDVTMSDILAVRKFVAGVIDKKDINFLASDLTEDGDVTMSDIMMLRKYIAGVGDIELGGNNEDGLYKVDTATIGDKNISRYSILIPEDADEVTDYSSKLLKDYVTKACGVALNITDSRVEEDSYYIEYRYDDKDEYSLGDDGYRVEVTDDEELVMTCGAKRGPLYATYYLLEKYIGYRFLTDRITYLYQASNVDLPVGYEDTEIPIFEYRGLNQVGAGERRDEHWDDWEYRERVLARDLALRINAVDAGCSYICSDAKYGGGVGNLYIHGHSYAYQEAVGMKLDEAHITDLDSPEAMAVFNTYGYNTPERDKLNLDVEQPCLTKESTFNHIMAFNYLLYRQRTVLGNYVPGVQYTMLSCSPNDNIEFCKCTECKKVYTEEGSISGTVFRMSNRVSEAMKDINPDVGIYTIAYWDARKPPLHTRPNDDVCVCFCIGGCNNHTFDCVDECVDCGGNARYRNYFKVWDVDSQSPQYPGFDVSNEYDLKCYAGWTELTNNIWVWYYACNFWYLISPCPNIFNIYNDFKYLAETGTTGIYCEGSSRGFTFESLRGYLACRMMWDPLMSEEEFEGYLDEALMIMYGPGWENIKQYIYMQDECGNLQGCFMNNFDRPWNFYNKDYFRDNFETMLGLFNAAYDATDNPDQKERIETARIHVCFLGLSATYESEWEQGNAAQQAAYKEKYDYLWNYINEYGYLDKKRPDGNYEVVCDGYLCVDLGFHEVRGGLSNFPESPDDVYDTMFWVMDDFHGDGT